MILNPPVQKVGFPFRRMSFPTVTCSFLQKNDNPRPSYRAEKPTNPQIGQKYQPDIQISPTLRDRKIPRKYQKNPAKIRFPYFAGIPGDLKGYFGASHISYVGFFLHVGFPILWLVEEFSKKKAASFCRKHAFSCNAMQFSRGRWQETAGSGRRLSGRKNQERQRAVTRI